MNLKPIPKAICRTPAFAIQSDLFTVWDELKDHIQLSSPEFHERIAHIRPEDWQGLPEKVRFTIWKYFNRSVFRATPFGTFAAFSVIPIAERTNGDLHLQQEMQIHRFVDWDEKLKVDKAELSSSLQIWRNSSCYQISEELRYISYDGKQFQLSSVELFPELELILEKSKTPLKLEALIDSLKTSFDLAPESSNEIIAQLLEAQILLSEQEANITGSDYFNRMELSAEVTDQNYILSERPVLKGALCNQSLRELPEFFERVARIMGPVERPGLQTFRTAFLRKFEGQEIPLSIALDPELGVGYEGLEQSTGQDLLIELPGQGKKESGKQRLTYGDFEQFLLQGIIHGQSIKLEEYEIKNTDEKLNIPNTFNALIQFYQGHPILISAGGCTATSLNGRFSLASEIVEAMNKEAAKLETAANPNVIFAEIAYQAEKHIDNVNRRKHCYRHEIPILSWSEGTEALQLEDIYVSAKNQEIVLRSIRHQKRIVPRLSSAYNYGRSDLSLYRFLCDLQYQNLHSQLSFQLCDFFPGLDHYPRMTYKNIIVSPGRWKVPKHLIPKPDEAALQHWLTTKQIYGQFKCGKADHLLCFDPNSAHDRWAFLQYMQQYREQDIYIWEALIDEVNGPKDEKGNVYQAEFVINFHHSEQVYQPVPKIAACPTFPIPEAQVCLPATKWVYEEIYCHPSRADSLLLGPIHSFITEHKEDIKQWFFIRYNDPAPHIRFRFQALQTAQHMHLIDKLHLLLKPDLQQGYIHDLQLKTYYREYHRYGVERMNLVEAFFHLDSLFVLKQLPEKYDTVNSYISTLGYLEQLSAIAFPQLIDQLEFVEYQAAAFAGEMSWHIEEFKQINQRFRSLRSILSEPSLQLLVDLAQKKIMEQILELCTNERDKTNLVASLIHMHINRLFSQEQRKHEALIYQFLLLYLKAKKAMSDIPQQYSA